MEDEVKEPAPKYNYISAEEYLNRERDSKEPNEYYEGQIYALQEPDAQYRLIRSNIIIATGEFLSVSNFEMLTTNTLAGSSSHDFYLYPDISIVDGSSEIENYIMSVLLSPCVLIEILHPLSISTQCIDKWQKLFIYQKIPSLKEYIMVDSQKKSISIARRLEDNMWECEDLKERTNNLHIKTIDLNLPLSEIYADTGL